MIVTLWSQRADPRKSLACRGLPNACAAGRSAKAAQSRIIFTPASVFRGFRHLSATHQRRLMKWLALLPSANYRLDFGWWDKHFDDLLSVLNAVSPSITSGANGATHFLAPRGTWVAFFTLALGGILFVKQNTRVSSFHGQQLRGHQLNSSELGMVSLELMSTEGDCDWPPSARRLRAGLSSFGRAARLRSQQRG